jgi:hypothetical protein
MGAPVTAAGAGFFLGFFASLVLRCCPLAMIVLLDKCRNSEKTATIVIRLKDASLRLD